TRIRRMGRRLGDRDLRNPTIDRGAATAADRLATDVSRGAMGAREPAAGVRRLSRARRLRGVLAAPRGSRERTAERSYARRSDVPRYALKGVPYMSCCRGRPSGRPTPALVLPVA